MGDVKIKKILSLPLVLLLASLLLFAVGYVCLLYSDTAVFTFDPAIYIFSASFIITFIALILSIIRIIRLKKTSFNIIQNIALILLSLVLLSITIIMILFSTLGPTLPSKKRDLEITSTELNVNLEKGKYLKRKDTHFGLLGDGFYFSIIQFKPEDDISAELKNNPEWAPLPMPDELRLSLGMEVEGKSLDLYYRDEGGVIIPDVKNGFYFFTNREKVLNPKDASTVLNSSSLNYSAAVYDCDNHILYYFMIDT